MFTIDLKSSKLKINARSISDIEIMIEEEKIYFDIHDYRPRIISNDDLSNKELKYLEEAWKIIKLIASEDNEPNIYIPKYRSKLIKKAIDELSISKTTVYKYLNKYWKGGKLKIVLLSELRNCGGKGKNRESSKKLGRPREFTEEQGRNITKEDKKIFNMALKKYRKPGSKVSLQKVYDLMIATYYTNCEIVDGEILIQEDNYPKPSFGQFKNFYYRSDRSIKDTIIQEKGEKEFLLNYNSITSNAKFDTFGPGYRYETDSTIPPVYLTNRLMSKENVIGKTKNIGRPTLTLVADVFSTLITGVYIDVSSASWEHVASALYSCTESKVEFCKSYGLKIKDEEWPNTYLPKKLLADNGELGGKAPESLVEFLNIEVENTRSYMGKDKPLIEGLFYKIEKEIISLIPGAIKNGTRKRGERDYRKDATLDIVEFTRIVLRVIVKHNNSRIENYPMLEGMIKDNIYPTPVSIWNWGVENLSSNLTVYDDDIIKVYLMREEIATVTEFGIEFIKRKYTCQIGENEEWFIQARNKGRWKVAIRYDKRNMNQIYIVDSKSERLIICTMKPEEEPFFNKSYDEIENYNKYMKEYKASKYKEQEYIKSKMNIGIINDIKEAMKTVPDDRSTRDMIDNIQENRRLESNDYGLTQALKISKSDTIKVDEEKISSSNNSRDISRDHLLDLIKNS